MCSLAVTTRALSVTHLSSLCRSCSPARVLSLLLLSLRAGISAAALASHEAMTFAALFFSFVLLVWLMATEVERKGTSSPATAAATDVKATSNSSAPSSSTAASASASDPSSPPPPSLLLHPSSALLSAQEFCAVLVLIAGIWYTAWMFSHGVLVMRHRSGFGAASASTASAVASAAAAAGGSTVGAARIIYVIFVTAGGENGGLFFGKLFGRHKLCRRLSPAKTVEGAFGQLGTSVAVSVIFRYYVAIDIPAGDSVILGLVLGFVGCVGDLFESFLKRSIGVKDAGHIIPGAGGMLDRMDGLIFNFPVMYAYLQWMHPITSGS